MRVPVTLLVYAVVLSLGLIVCSAGLTTEPASAQSPGAASPTTCPLEAEPNDDPATSPTIHGAICQAGDLPEGDAQDLVVWIVTGQDADHLWAPRLTGIAGSLTSLKILAIATPDDGTPIVAGSQLHQLDAPPEATTLIEGQAFLVAPGRYLLGISRSGFQPGFDTEAVSYTYSLDPATPLPEDRDVEPNDTPDLAVATQGAFDLSGATQDGPDSFAWTVSEEDANASWQLAMQAPLGSTLTLAISDQGGDQLATASTGPAGLAALYDLRLPPATYQLWVAEPGGTPVRYRLFAASSPPGDGDPEPNDFPAQAVPLSVGTLTKGRLGRIGDTDAYRVTVDQQSAQVLLDAKLIWFGSSTRTLCLSRVEGDTAGPNLKCIQESGGIALRGLALTPGEYLLLISGQEALADPYALRVDLTTAGRAGFEAEPNDDTGTATAMDATTALTGRSDGDPDYLRVRTTGEPQLWQIDVTGDGLEALALSRVDGSDLSTGQVSDDRTRVTLLEQYLIPGEHWLRVQGRGAEYTVQLTPLGAPDPDAEREPNNSPGDAERLRIGEQRLGRLSVGTDVDIYRFSLAARERVVVRIEPPEAGAVGFTISRSGIPLVSYSQPPPGEPLTYDALLDPGDYELSLAPAVLDDERYTVRILRGDPLTLAEDQEPNDSPSDAREIPASGTIRGQGDAWGGRDWFRLEPSADGAPLSVQVTGDVLDMGVFDGLVEYPMVSAGGGQYQSDPLPIGLPLQMWIRATGGYEVVMPGGQVPPAPKPLPVDLALALPLEPPAAFWMTGQRITGTLSLTSRAAGPLELALDTATSDPDWDLTLDQQRLVIDPGAAAEIPVNVALQPDLAAGTTVRLTVRARAPDGAQTTAFVELAADSNAPAIAPELVWPMPASMLGGLDVASLALGAVTQPSLDPTAEDLLHDGLVLSGSGLDLTAGSLPVDLTVDLAGDAPVPVSGMILDPVAGGSTYDGVVREFDLLLSQDGATWEPYVSGSLLTSGREQAFALPEPVLASYARLHVRSVHGPDQTHLVLGEWKVVAQPGFLPPDQALDLAAPERGGHIVWMTPQPFDYAMTTAMLDADPTRVTVTLEPDVQLAWVLAFRDHRAARIASFEWVDPPDADPATTVRSVQVLGSLASPFGPWTELGTWQLRASEGVPPEPFQLTEPTWLRYVQFVATAPTDALFGVDLPTQIRALESPVESDPRSILGEWGATSRLGPYEFGQLPEPPIVANEDAPDEMAGALPLAPAQAAQDSAHRGMDVDWYEVSIPEGQNSITFSIRGAPEVGVALRMVDDAGADVPLAFQRAQEGGTATYEGAVTPGATYRVEVRQPPLSAVITFDTSISLENYRPLVAQALRAFAASLTKGEEFIQFMPFDDDPLLPDWTDDQYLLQGALDAFLARESSSSAETGLIDASALLAEREGARAILVVSDAETSSPERSSELWGILDTVDPRVFSVHVGGATEPRLAIRLMQDWSAANRGAYQYARSQADIDRSFERMAAWLRRPSAYTLTFETEAREVEPPDPGTIVVVAPRGEDGQPSLVPVSSDVAIELVLDTSGSMLERIGGRRRIDIAKEVLGDLVTTTLPPGTPVALRTFRDEPRSCDTELAQPLAPLDPTALKAQIDGLTIDRSVNTPLAKAIAAVARDLSEVTGPRIVIVVSDGEENCGGDPARAVRRLTAEGLDVILNVVGLGLDRQARRQIERLAELGNGSYFDARDPDQLDAALAASVAAPFEILDAEGTRVGGGTVDGDAIELPPGTYHVVILTSPEQVIEDVIVTTDEITEVTAKPSAPVD